MKSLKSVKGNVRQLNQNNNDISHDKYAKGVDTLAKIKENQFPSIRVTDKLREETDKAAEIVDEKLSEYIRKAVEYRNNKVLEGK